MVIGEILNQFSVGVSSSIPDAWLLENLKVQINLSLWVMVYGWGESKVIASAKLSQRDPIDLF